MYQLRSALFLPEPVQATIEIEGPLPPVLTKEADQAARFLSRLVHKKTLSHLQVHTLTDPNLHPGGGAFRSGFVRLHPDADAKVVVHELGHALEHAIPQLHQRAKQWLDRVTQGGQLVQGPIEDSGGHTWSYRQRTDGVAPHGVDDLYLTRIYPGTDQTEVISQGLQKLFDNPKQVAQEDPTLLELLLKGLRP